MQLPAWLQLGAEDDWERPAVPLSRADLVLGIAAMLAVLVALELSRPWLGAEVRVRPRPVEYLVVAASAACLVTRRRWPLASVLAAMAVFAGACLWVGEVGYQFFYQLLWFVGIYSAVAWARDRRALALVVGAELLVLVVWISWDMAVGQGIDHHRKELDQAGGGLLGPVASLVLLTYLLNVCYVLTAAAMGQVAWHRAHVQAQLERSNRTIAEQAAELQDQAVLDERLRIAQELHDVVAHHVAVMGIQAAGARRLLDRDPHRAAQALSQVEDSSRQAVHQMRSLLGTLRGSQPGAEDRGPQPTLAELPGLVRELGDSGLVVDLAVVEQQPGLAAELPAPLQLSVFRTVQEALTNVLRHSTARRASVTVRLERHHVEAEVLDDGRPRGGTSGSGLGLLGMRERIASHGGTSEIGPRVTGGYRVRVRFPVDGPGASQRAGWTP